MSETMNLDEQGMPVGHPFNPDWECTPRQVASRLSGSDPVVLIDCRTDQERGIASIDGSIHVPMDDLTDHLESLREHEDDEIVVYCHHGVRSLQVTQWLRHEGFENVRSMAGGIDLWSHAVDQSTPTY